MIYIIRQTFYSKVEIFMVLIYRNQPKAVDYNLILCYLYNIILRIK